jgi:hypothetical protein
MECSFLFAKTIAKEGNKSRAGAFVVDAGMAEGRIFIWSAGRVARSKTKKNQKNRLLFFNRTDLLLPLGSCPCVATGCKKNS